MSDQHVQEVVKYGVDGVAGTTLLVSWIELLTPILNFAGLILAIIWGVYRIIDLRLAKKLKEKELDRYKGYDDDKS